MCASPNDYTEEQARTAASDLLALPEISITRDRQGRTKNVDIRRIITALTFVSRNPENGRLTWSAVVGIGEAGNVKPGDLASALSITLPGLTLRRAHRARLLTKEEAQALA